MDLEIEVELSNDLSPGRTVNSDGINGEVPSFEGPCSCRLDRDHDGYSHMSREKQTVTDSTLAALTHRTSNGE